MPRVFVSHSTEDREFVEQEIIRLLEWCGVETWYSNDSIQPMDQWERSILQGLKSCDVFLLVMSPRSAQSSWVKREVDWVFIKGGKRIIPVLMEECDPDDFHFGMRGIQHVDFSKDRNQGRKVLSKMWGRTEQPAKKLVDPARDEGRATAEQTTKGKTEDKDKASSLPPTHTNGLGAKLVLVPAGTFWMGGGGGKAGSNQVEIPSSFYIGVYPVTQGEWETVMGSNPSWFSCNGGGKRLVKGWFRSISDADLKLFPVETVYWDDIQIFLQKLNDREKVGGWVYRLPTEAEWEYACRGGASSKAECSYHFYLGRLSNDLSADQANFNWSVGRTSKVGSYKPNRLGIYDMHGNVMELTGTLEGSDRAIRGGSWNGSGECCQAAYRYGYVPSDRVNFFGFRLARVSVR